MIEKELLDRAEAGDAEAQFKIGCSYYESNETEFEKSRAVYWLEKSGKQGNKDAKKLLAKIKHLTENNPKVKIKENCGKSIKSLANAILVIGIILSFLPCIVIVVVAIFFGEQNETMIATWLPISILSLLIGVFFSWILSCIFNGFGELIQYTAECSSYLEEICKKQK